MGVGDFVDLVIAAFATFTAQIKQSNCKNANEKFCNDLFVPVMCKNSWKAIEPIAVGMKSSIV